MVSNSDAASAFDYGFTNLMNSRVFLAWHGRFAPTCIESNIQTIFIRWHYAVNLKKIAGSGGDKFVQRMFGNNYSLELAHKGDY